MVIETLNLDLSPSKIAEFWAREKARSISINNINSIVIGADTIVTSEDNIFGKPTKKKESMKMLQFLSGKTHQVITGVSMNYKKFNIEHTFHNLTQVTFQSYNKKNRIKEILQHYNNIHLYF